MKLYNRMQRHVESDAGQHEQEGGYDCIKFKSIMIEVFIYFAIHKVCGN